MTALGQSNFLQALGWAVLNSLWQMALLWVVYQIITAVFKISKSSNKSSLATTLLFAGFTWFVYSFIMILIDRNQAVSYSAFVPITGNEAINNWFYTSLPIASIVYLVLLILPALNFIRNYRYVQVIRRYGLRKADVQWRLFVKKVSAHLGIQKNVQIWMSEFVSSPVTIGYLKPVILLPMAAINHLSPQQIEAVLLHELSHIRRFDYLINLFTRMIQTILYFNPFVKAFSRIIERERENSCDEMVMQFQYEPHGYASALLTLEKAPRTEPKLAVAAAGTKGSELLKRVEAIMGIQKKNQFSFNKLAGVMAALLFFIGLNALLLMSQPSSKANASDGLFAQLSSPSLYFTDDNTSPSEIKSTPISNSLAGGQKEGVPANPIASIVSKAKDQDHLNSEAEEALRSATPADFKFVNFIESVIPQLDKAEEQQVKEAVDASRRVLEEGQWKTVESNIADAMTIAQKNQLKNAYLKAAEKADWDRLQDQLRLAYDKIDWKAVNSELQVALAEIKIDSIRQVCNTALASLGEIQSEMAKVNQKGIPDTDITSEVVAERMVAIEKVVNQIRTVKARKVVRL